jgi:HD-GYP domain-containing protein (c-di-GMP phosphodiesterase class II)
MADRAGLEPRVRERLQLAAIAHDYGKIYLEDLGFLTKEGPLTDREYQSVKQHPLLGAEKLGNTPHLKDVCRWIAEHHERWDGRGYPYGRKAEEISLPGRILGIVEVFDSLATRRSYKQPWPLEKVMDFFEDHRGKNFDPDLTDLFLQELEENGEEWIAQPQRDRAALGLDASPTVGANGSSATPNGNGAKVLARRAVGDAS